VAGNTAAASKMQVRRYEAYYAGGDQDALDDVPQVPEVHLGAKLGVQRMVGIGTLLNSQAAGTSPWQSSGTYTTNRRRACRARGCTRSDQKA